MSQAFAIDVDSVFKSFGTMRALDGVTLRVKEGEIYGLLGPNGAGKTTLMRMIVGLVAQDAGTVTVLGRRMPELDVLSKVGYMTQQAALYPDLSVEENLQFFAAISGATGNVTEELKTVYLEQRRNSSVSPLRGDMRHRGSVPCVP